MLIYAQDSGSANPAEDTLKQTAADVGGNLKNVGGNLTGGLRGAGEDLLEREVKIPGWLSVPARILFGIESGISWQKLIILLGVWFMMFIIIWDIVSLTPLFRGKIIPLLVSLIITIIISVSNGLSFLSTFLLGLTTIFHLLDDWPIVSTVISLIVILFLIFAAGWIMRGVKKSKIIGDAERRGLETGNDMKVIHLNAQAS
jgi:hypothetical protein